ncbi:class I SAM-dependent methyltransferase [Candidatus Nomurabacteria bacterium]|nr:class I SAM-dependent methyltransferase [Candidatus Nomurabacteria bacterium]
MFTDPLKNLKALGLREDNIVADLGAGTGYYSLISGTLVPKGKVYAIEVQKDFLETIKNKVKDAHLNNIEIIWGNVEKIGGTKLNDSVVDVVIASNILFQVEDRENFILEIKRILKQNGKVLLVDWLPSPVMKGSNIVPKQKACEMFEKKGFAVEREINTGDYNYGIILRKI